MASPKKKAGKKGIKVFTDAGEAAKKRQRIRAGKKAAATRKKNKAAADKAATKAEVDRLAARKEEHTGKQPAQAGLPDEWHERGGRVDAKHGIRTPEGAVLDPTTEGSADVARAVGTRGEKVSAGAGTRDRGFVKEQDTKGGRARAKKYNAIKIKIDNKTASPAERKWFMQAAKYDADAFKRQKGQTIRSRQNKSEAAKLRAAGGVDNYKMLLDLGVVSDDMTINQIKTAVRSHAARGNLRNPTASGDVVRAIAEDARQPKMARRRPLGQPTGHGGPEIFTPNPRRRRKNSKGGLVKTGHKDYRKGGIFY